MSDDVRLAHHQVVTLVAAVLHRGPVTPSKVTRSVERAERFLEYVTAARRGSGDDPLQTHGMAPGAVPYVWREPIRRDA